ncbi:MAG: hypothetical protein ACTHLA_09960 [Asticcacaulis sp.]|uniref:hypothetical protein n=1 Tax=Asticcacaulis sp. TaxID=1872648 RepID=UPI003F7BBFE2
MTQRDYKWLIRLFPGRWQDRYGQEFLELLDVEGLSAAAIFDIFKTIMLEWIVTLSAPRMYAMLAGPKQMITLSTKPSGALPLLMSLTALLIAVVYIATTGGQHQADEGAAAHIFQLMVVGQVPIIGFFLLRWIRTYPMACLGVVSRQILALVAALLPVWIYRL